MKKEIKDQWVAALRSGEYKQTDGFLTLVDLDGSAYHCCLGVLCELAVEADVSLDVEESYNDDEGVFMRSYDGRFSLLPTTVREWAGLEDDTRKLVDMNDFNGDTFAEIADYIETVY